MLYDLIASAIRTIVPMAVGALIAWGILPDSMSEPATAVFQLILSGAYYLLARVLETKWSWMGWLLGKPTSPTYSR